MESLQEVTGQFEYPGRCLLLGETDAGYVAVYAVTARSSASKAKRYVLTEDASKIVVVPTDQEIMAMGDLSLLDYTAVHFFENGFVIGNGRQTDEVQNLHAESALEQLKQNLVNISYEPDKYRTPRITGCILKKGDAVSAAFHIARANDAGVNNCDVHDVSLSVGKGMFLCTYAGPNIRPTPSFVGDPIPVEFTVSDANEAAIKVYKALAPQEGKEDLRVSVVSVVYDKELIKREVSIVNAVDEV